MTGSRMSGLVQEVEGGSLVTGSRERGLSERK